MDEHQQINITRETPKQRNNADRKAQKNCKSKVFYDDLVLPGPDSADEYIDSTPSSRQRRSRSRSRSRSRQMQLTSAETQAAADTLLNAMLQSPSLVNGLLEGGIELPLLSSSDTRNGTAAQPIQID